MCRGQGRHDQFDQLGDGTVVLGLDHVVHASPIWEGRIGVVPKHVILEREFPQGEKEELMPPHVLAGGRLKDDAQGSSCSRHRPLRVQKD